MLNKISLDLMRVTEAAAIAASKYVGCGDKIGADKAATDAMRVRLNGIDFTGKIIIGEGIKDDAPGLFAGEIVGCPSILPIASENMVDIAVDPIDGTRPTVNGGPGAIAVIAMTNHDCMYHTEDHYLFKLAVGKEVVDHFNKTYYHKPLLTIPLKDLVEGISLALRKPVGQVTVCIMDRDRHDDLRFQLRQIGCRIKLIQDCDVTASIAVCLPDKGIDMYYGIGGAPEAILAACAVECLGGEFQAMHISTDYDKIGEVLTKSHLINGPCIFAATGITDGSLLEGVKFDNYRNGKPTTNSVFMRSHSGTVRWMTTYHNND